MKKQSLDTQPLYTLADLLSTSLGPCGMDKILVSQDNDIFLTNDGATILKNMEMENPISQIVTQLSESQDDEIGDGTTGVVLIAAELMKQSFNLIRNGWHPIKIIDGLDRALELAKSHLEEIAEEKSFDTIAIDAAKTSLGSKIAFKSLDNIANICVEAVKKTKTLVENGKYDLNFDLIKIESKTGSDISDTKLIDGVLINKEVAHPQMKKSLKDAKIALLACPFEPPKLKTNNSIEITNVEEFKKLEDYERKKFLEMIQKLKEVGATAVLCQWGFDDEATSALMENDILAVRWVGGPELELVALHTNGNIIPRFEDITKEDLGTANIEEISLGTENEKSIIISGGSNTVTIFIRGSTKVAIEEVKRSINDALYAVRNVLVPKIVYGGGATELSLAKFLFEKSQETEKNEESQFRECFSTLAEALLIIPKTLAKNACVEESEALKYKSKYDGVDCGNGTNMKNVFDSIESKRNQLSIVVQVVTTLLKIDEVIVNEENLQ